MGVEVLARDEVYVCKIAPGMSRGGAQLDEICICLKYEEKWI